MLFFVVRYAEKLHAYNTAEAKPENLSKFGKRVGKLTFFNNEKINFYPNCISGK